MNLVKLYMQKFIWKNTEVVNIHIRQKKAIEESVIKFMGAPEVLSVDKRFAILITFKSFLKPNMIYPFLFNEYSSLRIKNGGKIILIQDAAIIFKRVSNGSLIIEMNSEQLEVKKVANE